MKSQKALAAHVSCPEQPLMLRLPANASSSAAAMSWAAVLSVEYWQMFVSTATPSVIAILLNSPQPTANSNPHCESTVVSVTVLLPSSLIVLNYSDIHIKDKSEKITVQIIISHHIILYYCFSCCFVNVIMQYTMQLSQLLVTSDLQLNRFHWKPFFKEGIISVISDWGNKHVCLEEASSTLFSIHSDIKSQGLVWFTVSWTVLRKEPNQLCLKNEPLDNGTEVLISAGSH